MANQRKYSVVALAVVVLAALAAQATSHVRIVRLSYTDGNVQMDRAAGQGLERAILNSPIVEGASVVTGADGLAEVEFENNSAVRLGEATDVTFRQLLMNDAGDKVNEVELVRGTIYFDTRSGKDNVYRVIAAGHTFAVQRNSQVRFLMNGDQVEVAVLNGEAQLENGAEAVKIKKNDTLTLDPASQAGFTVAKGVDTLPLDRWSNERAAYQNVYAYSNAGFGTLGGPQLAGFGYQDLAYYGGFFNMPGYGMAWQPYGISSWMGWNPYVAGAWAFTPSLGYAWASAYPWGWLPYHYGSWAFASGTGWFWVPGNSFGHGGIATNWQPTTAVVNGPAGYKAPVAPAVPVGGPRPSVMVGRIGNAPAYIPGGPVPPNFRSVINRSSIPGMTSPVAGSTGAGKPVARNSRAAGFSGTNTAAAKGSTFAAPSAANPSGHVFALPAQPSWSSHGSTASWTPGTGAVTSGQGAGIPMHNSSGTSRATGGTAHSSGGTTPK